MARKRCYLAIILGFSFALFYLFQIDRTYSFIERLYTLKEVLDASTNIAFGKVESVDQQKQLVIVKLQENLKGKSDFSHIKINVALGDVRPKQSTPDMLMGKFRVGLPVIIFYSKEEANLAGLGYVSGTWFQIFGTDLPDRNRVWWRFTHIEIYMNRTFRGTTEEFQNSVRKALGGKATSGPGRDMNSKDNIKVLVLTGNGANFEFPALRNFNRIGKWNVSYSEIRDKDLPGLDEVHILWIGLDEIGKDGYQLRANSENAIRSFVKRGGIVITSSQDSDEGRLCETGWLPEPITGVEEASRRDFQPSGKAGALFTSPNQVKSGTVYFDDTWTGWNSKYDILATTNNGKNIALARLRYGKGMYLITALVNESDAQVKANAPLMENIMYQAVKWLKGGI